MQQSLTDSISWGGAQVTNVEPFSDSMLMLVTHPDELFADFTDLRVDFQPVCHFKMSACLPECAVNATSVASGLYYRLHALFTCLHRKHYTACEVFGLC